MFQISTCLCISALLVLTSAMPVELIGSRVADLVLNSCMDTSSGDNSSISLSSEMQLALAAAAGRANESVLLDQWRQMSTSVIDTLDEVLTSFKIWSTNNVTMKQSASSIMTIIVTDRPTLTPTINARLNAISQMAMYADFLKSQQSSNVYGSARDLLRNVTRELNTAICTVKQLLSPALSNDAIRTYVMESCNKQDLAKALVGWNGICKRAVTYYVLELTKASLTQVKIE